MGERLQLMDFEAGAKTTGHGFYFLKNDAVLLDLALQRSGERIVKLQTGYLYHYAFAMMIGLALLLSYVTYINGGFVR